MSTTLSAVQPVLFTERKFYIDNPMSMEDIFAVVRAHASIAQAYRTLHNYYRGKHIILDRKFDDTNKPNNKLVHNFPKLIVDNSVAYFMGKPISYTGDTDLLDKIQPILDANHVHSVDSELAKYCAEFGHGFEVYWYDNVTSELRFKQISPENMIMCYSPDIDEVEQCAIYYKHMIDAKTSERIYKVTVYTNKFIYSFIGNLEGRLERVGEPQEHYFGRVPVIEYIANEDRMGDFEPVISLIDAYNVACADSVNDINYLNDAYLLLKNLSASESSDINEMKNNRVMLVDGDGDASWLVKNINDLHIENIKKRLVEDIHKFSMTPNISDEKFASNLSGVAISYKLNSLESKTAVKERHFTQAIQKRLEIICTALSRDGFASNLSGVAISYKLNSLESKTAVKERHFTQAIQKRLEIICTALSRDGKEYDSTTVYPTFTRNIPQNLLDLVSSVVQLQGIVPNEELLGLLPFIDDVEYALDKLREEKEENMEAGYGMFDLGGTEDVQQGDKQTDNFDK